MSFSRNQYHGHSDPPPGVYRGGPHGYANVKGEQANHLMRKIPYTIIPGEEGKLRKDIFLERAIVERACPSGHGPAHPPHG